MKVFKKLLLVSLFALISQSAFSQLSIGGNFSYMNYFGDNSDLSSAGLSLRGDYALREDLAVTGAFSYYFPKTESYEYTLTPINFGTTPSATVDGEDKYNFFHFYVGMKKYWVGDVEDDFGLYGELDLGLIWSPYSSEVGNYDRSAYQEIETYDETYSNFFIGLGLGLEKEFDFGYIFAETKLNIPANQENGEEVAIEIPGNIMFNVGLRYPLDM